MGPRHAHSLQYNLRFHPARLQILWSFCEIHLQRIDFVTDCLLPSLVAARPQVVPITLIGTGDLMPNAREGELYPGTVRIVVHPPIACGKGTNADAVCTAARAAVASALPPELVGSADASADSE